MILANTGEHGFDNPRIIAGTTRRAVADAILRRCPEALRSRVAPVLGAWIEGREHEALKPHPQNPRPHHKTCYIDDDRFAFTIASEDGVEVA